MTVSSTLLATLVGTTAVVVCTQSAMALSMAEISQVAKSLTVRIDSQTPGSGVIVKREGNTYTVVTSAHVVATNDNYEIITPDKKTYSIDLKTIKRFPNVDLATVEFQSSKVYPVATIGDSSKVVEGTGSFIAGFPIRTAAISESIYNFTRGEITGVSNQPLKDGYGLIYTNTTLPGMSGGPVFNESAHLVGIHGRANTTNQVQDERLNQDVYVKVGVNLGIPINTFVQQFSKSGLKLATAAPLPKPVSTTPTTTPIVPSPANNQLYAQGQDQYNRQDYRGAISTLSRSIQQDNRNAQAYAKRGRANIRIGNDTAALRDSQQAVQINPQLAEAYIARAEARLAKTDCQGGIADANKALTLKPQLADAYVVLGSCKVFLGQYREALADSEKAIQLDPKLAYGYAARGLVYLAQGKPSKALSDGTRAIQLNPQLADAYLVRGTVHRSNNNFSKALADFDRVIQLEPQNAFAYAFRGQIHALNGNMQGAISDSQAALRFDINEPHAYITQAIVYINAANVQGARESLQRAASLAQQQSKFPLVQEIQKLLGQLPR